MAFNFAYPMNPERDPIILPSEPTNLQVVSDSDTQVTISWDASIAGDFPIVEYEIIANDALIGSTPTLFYPWDSVPANEAIDYKVRAVDNQGNRSAFSDIVTYTNVVPQTGVDTTTGQVDIAFTDATNVVYWNGSQYLQTEVTDTPIETWEEVELDVDDYCTKHDDEVSVFTWNPSGNTPADSFDYVITTAGSSNTRPIMRAAIAPNSVVGDDYRFTFNATWDTGGSNVQPVIYQVSIGDSQVINYAILQGANEILITANGTSTSWLFYYPSSNKIFDLQMRDMKLFRKI